MTMQMLWNEASDVFKFEDQFTQWRIEDNLRCIISIGTGKSTIEEYDDSVKGITRTLVKISTETENTADEFHRRHTHLDDESRYFRFNVDVGLENIGLEETKRKDKIMAVTRTYCQGETVHKRIRRCVDSLCEVERASVFA